MQKLLLVHGVVLVVFGGIFYSFGVILIDNDTLFPLIILIAPRLGKTKSYIWDFVLGVLGWEIGVFGF
ncbi:MAG: hypothetical protein Q8M15_10765 [Bacteroidota bacterium]|nr:hypothetical protein [Bacteroidota bacterium]